MNLLRVIDIVDLKVYSKFDLIEIEGSRSIQIEDSQIQNVYPATGVLNANVKVLQTDIEHEIYALISYTIKGIKKENVPANLISVQAQTVQDN